MKEIQRIQWIASFDIEPVIGKLLRRGTLLSGILIATGLALQYFGKTPADFGPNLHAKSLLDLMFNGLDQGDLPGFWPHFLFRAGVSTLLLTTYTRQLVSMLYFGWIERNWKHALFSGFVLIVITMGLFINLV